MHVRILALAFPLVLGVAGCQTSSKQSEGRPTASAPGSGSETSGASAPRDPMVRPGPSVKGHAEDKVVDGRISRVSGGSLSIESDRGETRILELAPQTLIRVNGQDASHADLQEGQPVRASYSEVEGRNVAVEVRAGEGATEEESSTYPGAAPVPNPADVRPGREPYRSTEGAR